MRKLTILILSICLITGAVAATATAASVDLGYNILHSELILRGSVEPFFLETPLAQKDWNSSGTNTWGIAGINAGLKGPGASPFYGIMQLNISRQLSSGKYKINTIELGPGVEFSMLKDTDFYAEFTCANINFKDFDKIKWNFELGVNANFALFPAPKEVG